MIINEQEMQPIEILTLVLFLLNYLYSAFYALIRPESYRLTEISFYKTGKPRWDEYLMFLFLGISFIAMILHFIFETPFAGQLILYLLVMLHTIVSPFHFMPFYRQRMVSSLGQKTATKYRKHGINKLIIAGIMILLPLIIPR